MLGGAAIQLFSAIITPPLERRRQEWMEEVGAALRKLEEERGIKLEDLQNNPVFIDTIMHASQAALRNSQEEKRHALRNAILNAALPNPPEEAIQQMFIDLIDTFTEWHLRFLKLFHDPCLWFETHESRPRGPSLASVLEAAFPALHGRRSFYDQIWRDLYTRGLGTIEGLHGMMTGHGLVQRRTTEMGEQFLQFIEEPLRKCGPTPANQGIQPTRQQPCAADTCALGCNSQTSLFCAKLAARLARLQERECHDS